MTTKTNCCVHPAKPGQWFCPKCKQIFCSDCIIKLDGNPVGSNKISRFCPKCTVETRQLDAGGRKTFWQKLFSPPPKDIPKVEIEESNDIAQPSPPPPKKAVADNPIIIELKKVDNLSRDGKIEEAIEHIRQWQKNGGALNIHLAERYFDLLKKASHTEEMLAHARIYLGLAIEMGNKAKVLDIYEACISADSKFVVDPKVMLKIGEWLSDAGKPKEAIKVFSGLTKNYPEAVEVPVSYFQAAKIYHDQLKDRERAKNILEQLIQKYPDHKMIPKFKTYLDHIK